MNIQQKFSQSQSNELQQEFEQQSLNSELLEQEELKIKNQLKNVPYGFLLKMQQKKNAEQIKSDPVKTMAQKMRRKKLQQQSLKANEQQKNKDTPKQIKIMRRPVRNQHKLIFRSQKAKTVDPRFEDYAGNYNRDLAMKSFGFIPEVQKNQAKQLKSKLKKGKMSQLDKQILKNNYNKITSDMKRVQLQNLQYDVMRKQKKQLQEKGTQNFFIKKNAFKEEFQRVKINTMTQSQRDKKFKKKVKTIEKSKMIKKKILRK